MALRIERAIGEGFRIGPDRYEIVAIGSPRDAHVRRERDGEIFPLAYGAAVEVSPGIRLQIGDRGGNTRVAVLITAPRELEILRDEHGSP